MTPDVATATLWGTLLVSVGGFVASIIWDVLDRRRQARKDVQDGSLGERQFLSRAMQDLIAHIERDRDHNARERDELQAETDTVWEAFAQYACSTHELRHTAAQHILTLYGDAGRTPADHRLPELSSIRNAYNIEKSKAKNANP